MEKTGTYWTAGKSAQPTLQASRTDAPPWTKHDRSLAGKPLGGSGKEEHHLAQYGGAGGSWRELLGRHSWFLFHSLAAMFPAHPREAPPLPRSFACVLRKFRRWHLERATSEP